MKTYKVVLTVETQHTVEVTTPTYLTQGDLRFVAANKLGLNESDIVRSHAWDVTPKEPTDKDRFNDAFKALRKMGYAAKQNQSRNAPEYPERHVMTLADDVDAFRYGRLVGMVPIHWDSDNIRLANVDSIMQVFKDHGFDVEWGGKFYNCIEIRKGVEA